MTTPTPDNWPPRAPAQGGSPQGRPRGPVPPYGHPSYQQQHPGYQQYGGPHGEWPDERIDGGRVMRSVLILAGVAGVITVLVGMLYMVAAPEQYGLADQRTTLPPRSQANATGPADPYFQAEPTEPPPLPNIPAAPAMQPSTPVRVVIPRLGVNAPIRSVGLDKQGAIEVPPVTNPNLVGWYRSGPTAGEAGPAIMLGHKDTKSGSAVFSRLDEIRNGDVIEVHRKDGIVAVFTVGGLEQAEKAVFPTQRVYGESPNPQLHLITCGGTYDRATGHYTDNVIAYATMTSTRKA
ncbi:class F sortase [Streptosporangium canum]|uniref:Sortase (Surface protein transpeptidase) n=1 Tax=Streptosporangium canum TaxID=324952 RepID=A0A1I3FY45_9ACTN|nr:class F sortase [Streptosporangium canum]SFI16150.1 Sortase (surface protein transpeptidase) [Streptosporangium canum]